MMVPYPQADFLGYPAGRLRAPKNWSESDEFGRIMSEAGDDELTESRGKSAGGGDDNGGGNGGGGGGGGEKASSAGSYVESGSDGAASEGAPSDASKDREEGEKEKEEKKKRVKAGFEGSEAYHKRQTLSLML